MHVLHIFGSWPNDQWNSNNWKKKAPKMHLYLPIFEWMCYTNTWNFKIYCLKQETKLYTSLFNGIKMNALLKGKY